MLRAPKSKEGYAAIGGGSPLRKITDEQVEITVLLKCLAFLFFVCIFVCEIHSARSLKNCDPAAMAYLL